MTLNISLIFVWLLLATIAVQVPNVMGIGAMSDGGLTLAGAAKISLITLPAGFAATVGFTLFYGRGSEFFSYPAMAVYAKGASLLAAIAIQVWLLKSRSISGAEIIGASLCLVGFLVAVFGRQSGG